MFLVIEMFERMRCFIICLGFRCIINIKILMIRYEFFGNY